jgi:hypothetical protein
LGALFSRKKEKMQANASDTAYQPQWNESLFPRLQSADVFAPQDVEALIPRVDMAHVYAEIERGRFCGKGSAHACVAHAGLALRVCRKRNEHKSVAHRNEMLCELRYAQLAHDAGVGLPSPFFGVVRFNAMDERLLSCWPLGKPLDLPSAGEVEESARVRAALRAALEGLSTRLVALDACKPANWVTVEGALYAIDFETHLCFPTQTPEQKAAALDFVPVMLALFEMCSDLKFVTGVQGMLNVDTGGCDVSVESLSASFHGAMCGLLDAYSGRYQSFASVRFCCADVSYAIVCVLVKYTEFCIGDIEGAGRTVDALQLMCKALQTTRHVHHTYAVSIVNDPRCVRDLLLPFATLLASLVDGAVRRPKQAEAVKTFHASLCAVWQPNETARKKRRFEHLLY